MLGVLSILVSVFCGWFFLRTAKRLTGDIDKTTDLKTVETPDKVDVAQFLQKLDAYISAVKIGNIRRLNSIMSDTMYHLTETNAQDLARVGVRREIEYVTSGFIEPSPIMSDGKVSWSSVQFPCRYTERFVDSQTNQVLHTIQYEKATIVMHITRSDARAPGEEVSCIGCGQPVNTSGELFICQHCGATYTSDSYDWSISGYAALNAKGNSPAERRMQQATYAAMIAMVALPILGFIAIGLSFLNVVVILGNILLLGGVLYWGLWVVGNSLRGITDMKRIDPLFSVQKFDSRVQYLMAIFFSAMNYNPNSLKPFIDPFIYAEIMQSYQPTGNYVLKAWTAGQSKLSPATRHEGKIYISFTMDWDIWVFDSSRRVQKITKNFTFQMCRAESAMTTLKPTADVLECPGCGRSINLTANGKCKYCGADYDLSQVDWILGRVDNSMFV